MAKKAAKRMTHGGSVGVYGKAKRRRVRPDPRRGGTPVRKAPPTVQEPHGRPNPVGGPHGGPFGDTPFAGPGPQPAPRFRVPRTVELQRQLMAFGVPASQVRQIIAGGPAAIRAAFEKYGHHGGPPRPLKRGGTVKSKRKR